MSLSVDSARAEDPTFRLEGVVRNKSEPTDFEGPLSLILLLLSKNKIEIRDIPVAEILDQYLEYLNEMQRLDLEIASEFVQMASYLLYIKTRMLLTEEKEITELEQLISSLEQLKCRDAYAAVKAVVPALEAAAVEGLQRFSRPPEPLGKKSREYRYRIAPEELLGALVAVYVRPEAQTPPPTALRAPQRIVYSVQEKSRALLELLRDAGPQPLGALYARCGSRSEVVATFLSVLELCSLGRLRLFERDGEYTASFAGGDPAESASATEE